jgi:hypothetical protein
MLIQREYLYNFSLHNTILYTHKWKMSSNASEELYIPAIINSGLSFVGCGSVVLE